MSFLCRGRFFVITLVVAATLLLAQTALANIMVIPTRIVFEGRQRSAILLVMNTDNKPHSYRLNWKIMKMDEMGQYHDMPLDPADTHSAANMLIFSPRQMRLEPNGRQNVRLSLRRPADLPPGEYRAHLSFDALPDDDQPSLRPGADKSPTLSLKLLVGVSIPVIVRNEGAIGAVSIDEISLQALSNNQPAMTLAVKHPVGANSAYGQIQILLQKDGNSEQVGLLNNVALYPEQEKRVMTVPLTIPLPPGSTVKVVYEGAGEYMGTTLATKEISITR